MTDLTGVPHQSWSRVAEHSHLVQDIHKQLEEKISRFHGTEDTILYPSCFDANAALFESLLTAEDAVISDKLNHASIIDGIRLCKAERHRCVRITEGDKTPPVSMAWAVESGAGRSMPKLP